MRPYQNRSQFYHYHIEGILRSLVLSYYLVSKEIRCFAVSLYSGLSNSRKSRGSCKNVWSHPPLSKKTNSKFQNRAYSSPSASSMSVWVKGCQRISIFHLFFNAKKVVICKCLISSSPLCHHKIARKFTHHVFNVLKWSS